MGQDFGFGFSDALLAEVSGINQNKLHSDAEAILSAYEKIKPLAKRLAVESPIPRIAGFCYPLMIQKEHINF